MVDVLEEIKKRWKCPKCGTSDPYINEHSFTGSGLSRLLNWQAYTYIAITCRHCGYTEFYNKEILTGKKDTLMQILDLLFGT